MVTRHGTDEDTEIEPTRMVTLFTCRLLRIPGRKTRATTDDEVADELQEMIADALGQMAAEMHAEHPGSVVQETLLTEVTLSDLFSDGDTRLLLVVIGSSRPGRIR